MDITQIEADGSDEVSRKSVMKCQLQKKKENLPRKCRKKTEKENNYIQTTLVMSGQKVNFLKHPTTDGEPRRKQQGTFKKKGKGFSEKMAKISNLKLLSCNSGQSDLDQNDQKTLQTSITKFFKSVQT